MKCDKCGKEVNQLIFLPQIKNPKKLTGATGIWVCSECYQDFICERCGGLVLDGRCLRCGWCKNCG